MARSFPTRLFLWNSTPSLFISSPAPLCSTCSDTLPCVLTQTRLVVVEHRAKDCGEVLNYPLITTALRSCIELTVGSWTYQPPTPALVPGIYTTLSSTACSASLQTFLFFFTRTCLSVETRLIHKHLHCLRTLSQVPKTGLSNSGF